MSIESRLTKLESAVTIPRTVEQLARDYLLQVSDSHQSRAWFAGLTDDEVNLASAEFDRQFPQVDFSQLTDEEIDRIHDLNADEIRQLVAGDFSPLGRAA